MLIVCLGDMLLIDRADHGCKMSYNSIGALKKRMFRNGEGWEEGMWRDTEEDREEVR